MTFSLFLFYLFVFTLNSSSSSSTVIKLETTTNKYKKAPSAAKETLISRHTNALAAATARGNFSIKIPLFFISVRLSP